MANRAIVTSTGLGGSILIRRFHMLGSRSMASLTGNILVIGFRLEIINGVMAIVTGCDPGVDNFTSFILFNGLSTIMSQDSKTGGDKKSPGDQKESENDDENDSNAYQLLRNFPEVFQLTPSTFNKKITALLDSSRQI
ncbi:MAG: hypothetical protein A2351_02460 [Omnitrophica bacterium RIFOXYB12_FULL_50_7]|nr:MAG: hypothetical protein A2351_02460 [Omnitrophica bacterium RIFOXYB12_FULL_50_7]